MTYKNFTVETDADGIALVTWDMPDRSMNVFTVEVMDELEKIVDQVVADAGDQGRGHHLRQGQFFRWRRHHDAAGMLGLFQEEKAKNPEKAAKLLFDGVGRMGGCGASSRHQASPGCRRSTALAWAALSSSRSPATAVSPRTATR